MIHIVVCGHAQVAEGIYSGAKLLSGELKGCHVVNFFEDMSEEELQNLIRAAVEKIDAKQPILFLTDIVGGTPFRACSNIAQQRDKTEVITGLNLQMLVEAIIERQYVKGNINILARELVENTKDGISLLSDRLIKNTEKNKIC